MNLWEETQETLIAYGLTWNDITSVRGATFEITKENFEELARVTFYDNGYGSQEIATDLKLIGDNFWFSRGEYDGSEWWSFHSKPSDNIPTIKVKTLCCGYKNDCVGWSTLEELNKEEV